MMSRLTYIEFTQRVQKLSDFPNNDIHSIKDFCKITGYSYSTVIGWRDREFVPGIAYSWLNLYEELMLLREKCKQYQDKCQELEVLSAGLKKIGEHK
ncbi:hypothetical protein [Cysteiniphilum litorale]|uniref:hypothetical protein n=1 Tax=Cysteiniphilum litorale TaxID=2056700 RepID=UPI003F882B14